MKDFITFVLEACVWGWIAIPTFGNQKYGIDTKILILFHGTHTNAPLCAPVPDTSNVGFSINLWNSDDPKIPQRKYIQVFINHSGSKIVCPCFQFMRNKNKNWWISINMGDLTTSQQIWLIRLTFRSNEWQEKLYPVSYYVCPASFKFKLSALSWKMFACHIKARSWID